MKDQKENNADLFSQPPLLIFIKGANISGWYCMFRYDQFQGACCWERKKIPKIIYHCYQYLFFLHYSFLQSFLH